MACERAGFIGMRSTRKTLTKHDFDAAISGSSGGAVILGAITGQLAAVATNPH
jgi:hypothetical protein